MSWIFMSLVDTSMLSGNAAMSAYWWIASVEDRARCRVQRVERRPEVEILLVRRRATLLAFDQRLEEAHALRLVLGLDGRHLRLLVFAGAHQRATPEMNRNFTFGSLWYDASEIGAMVIAPVVRRAGPRPADRPCR